MRTGIVIMGFSLAPCLAGTRVARAHETASPAISVPVHAGAGFPDAYLLDDASGETSFGSPTGHIGWINRFEVVHGYEVITEVLAAFGLIPAGVPVKAYVWSDPDQDGSPADAKVLSSAAGFTANVNSDNFITIDIPNVFVGPAGTSFFVGLITTHAPFEFPARIDVTRPAMQSWYAAHFSPLDPEDLAAASVLAPMHEFGAAFAGNWMVRASAFPSPGAATVLAFGVALLGRHR